MLEIKSNYVIRIFLINEELKRISRNNIEYECEPIKEKNI